MGTGARVRDQTSVLSLLLVSDWRNLVGTGPMMLTDWTNGSSITWDKNPD